MILTNRVVSNAKDVADKQVYYS